MSSLHITPKLVTRIVVSPNKFPTLYFGKTVFGESKFGVTGGHGFSVAVFTMNILTEIVEFLHPVHVHPPIM